jgi:hypothetical protein
MSGLIWMGVITTGLVSCIGLARSKPGAIAAAIALAVWWGFLTALYWFGLSTGAMLTRLHSFEVPNQDAKRTLCFGLVGIGLLAAARALRIAVVRHRDWRERTTRNAIRMQS